MSGLLIALAVAAQPPQQPPEPPLRSDMPPERQLSPAHDLFYEDLERNLTPQALVALRSFGQCVVSNSRDMAARTIRSDFTSRRYRNALRQLARNNQGCLRVRGRLSGTGLMFAGAVAEALLREDPAPINVRLARAADSPPPPAYAPTDRVALCTVRSVPDQVASLFASEPGSGGENDAIAALAPAVRLCSQGGPEVQVPPAGLRAMLATAAYRVVTNGQGEGAASADRSGN